MPVIYEGPDRDTDYTAWLRERDIMRTKAWERVLQARAARDLAQANAVERARVFAAEMRESAQRAGTYGIGERIRIRSNEKKMRVALQREAEREYAVVERHYYGTWGQPGTTRATDLEDYRQASIDAYDRDGIDPVLLAVPRSRRHVDANGWSVYTTKSMLHGTRELLRTIGDLTYVRGTDDTVIRAAVTLAASKSRNPLRFNGSAAFVARAQEIAHELGVATVGAPMPSANTISTESPDSVDIGSPYAAPGNAPPADSMSEREDLSPDLVERGRRAAAEARGEVPDTVNAQPDDVRDSGGEAEQSPSQVPAFDAVAVATQLQVDRNDLRPGFQLGEPWGADGVILADGTVDGHRYIVLGAELGALVLPVPDGVVLGEHPIGATVKVMCDDSGLRASEVTAPSESASMAPPDVAAEAAQPDADAPDEVRQPEAPPAKASKGKKPRGRRS